MIPEIIIINGPAGVGKTTVSKKLGQSLENSVVIHGDMLRSFAPENAASFLGEGSTYLVAARLTQTYLSLGAKHVIFEYVFERSVDLSRYKSSLVENHTCMQVTLWASLDIVSAREATRHSRERLGARVATCYKAMQKTLSALGTIIETANLSPDEVVNRIRATW
jgi:cytidylate kinase